MAKNLSRTRMAICTYRLIFLLIINNISYFIYYLQYLNFLKIDIIMNIEEIKFLPYTATSISIIARFIFMFLLYKNKSTNSLSLLFCILNIFSSSMWLYYSVNMNDFPMTLRSSTELSLLIISSIYITFNKLLHQNIQTQVLPT